MTRNKLLLFMTLALVFGIAADGQTPESALKPTVVMGDVVSLDASRIVLQAKDGRIEVTLSDKTEFKKVPADNPVLKAAVPSAFSEIGVGDKLVVSGIYPVDRKTLPARSVYLMSRSDIAQKQAKESEQWKTRGIAGRVLTVNPQTNQISIEVRGLMGSSNVAVTTKEKAKFLRYAPDSVKFSEAKESTLVEIKPGDMLRALGDKNADGTAFTAEKVITGAFQTRAGTVKSIDTAKNEIVVTDLQTKKDLAIAFSSSSILKRFPEEMAQRMAQFQMGGARPAAGQPGAPAQQANPVAGQGQTGTPRPGGFGGPQRGGGIDDMLDRFPNITAADLKVGDVIAVSSTKNADVDRITAIKLLAGVEPFLRAAQANAATQPGASRRPLDLNIPGLDGFGTP